MPPPPFADAVIRAGAIHTMHEGQPAQRALAINDGRISAIHTDPGGLDAWVGPDTAVLDDQGLTVLPGFIDTHTHLMYAMRSVRDVPANRAATIAELVDLIRQRAAETPAGQWIRTTAAWHELALAERRLPTALELDEATLQHPVLVKRGGHNVVANSLALAMAGVTKDTPDPDGGTIVRDPADHPTGWLIETPAFGPVEGLVPPPTPGQQADDLNLAALGYAAQGLTTVRDAAVEIDEMPLLQDLWRGGRLPIRIRAMYLINPSGPVEARIAATDGLGARSGFGDDWLRIWGLKLIVDGGAEAAALEQPYPGRPGYKGTLIWQPAELARYVEHAFGQGWRIGAHACGDRTLRVILDAYEAALARHPRTLVNQLVIEHAVLADREQRARAIRLGIPVTVQHPLLYTAAAALVENWGEERAHRCLPVQPWIEEGALVAAGSDYPVGAFDAMRSVWGLVTRQTRGIGPLNPGYAVDRRTAIELYTTRAAQLIAESDRLGSLAPGKLADLCAYRADPLTCPVDDLPGLQPELTIVGGQPAHGPGTHWKPRRG